MESLSPLAMNFFLFCSCLNWDWPFLATEYHSYSCFQLWWASWKCKMWICIWLFLVTKYIQRQVNQEARNEMKWNLFISHYNLTSEYNIYIFKIILIFSELLDCNRGYLIESPNTFYWKSTKEKKVGMVLGAKCGPN